MSNKTNPNDSINNSENFPKDGLTKREYFAGLAMQGLINKTPSLYYSCIGGEAVKIADDLIEALNKGDNNEQQ